ncbi:DUF2950 domain-containing protein [Mesorhizobium sp. BAC0120]|uniref:DUF2950 domain-containing protein n=1 Tax=Mesorhizobium sp. BAC0120 TaxID=3090670 RepID=UPI00298CCCDB|nr:DUF2950 domain-containing protein [Mesorhizobium sp. BAC0120]MDW6021024.1 DUF2950 domain-containing protein [Mesorhizobium sp. BAC0120]
MRSSLTILRAWLNAAAIVAVVAVSGSGMAFAQDRTGIYSFAADKKPPTFDDPGAAIDAFKDALAKNDVAALANLVGLNVEKLKADKDVMSTFDQIRDAAAKQVVVEDLNDRKILDLGDKLWPFPFPLVKAPDAKWAFDTNAGFEEIINRRVGENELQAIDTMHEYVDAQREYASQVRDASGVLKYAQKLISSPGKTDGLYWPPDQGDGDSPAGNFANQAALEKAKKGEGYFGYRFRILTGQGDNVAGGAYDYVINGNMIGGFALVAWPVKYRETGVNTFLVNQQGVVYQADLGPQTEEIVKRMKRFNPGAQWSVVGD